jgi:hypothetical protein
MALAPDAGVGISVGNRVWRSAVKCRWAIVMRVPGRRARPDQSSIAQGSANNHPEWPGLMAGSLIPVMARGAVLLFALFCPQCSVRSVLSTVLLSD